jgi:uncharacterized alkaline shock family protein YloU
MNLGFRILMAVYGFCMTVVSIVLMLVTIKPELFDLMTNNISFQLHQNRNFSFILFIIGFIFFSMSLTFLLSGFKSPKDKMAFKKHTNVGIVRISHAAIENIALNATRKISAVKDAKAYIHATGEDTAAVIIKAVVQSDVNIPVLSEDVQVRVKKSVEESAGINVTEVKVIVENIYSAYKARVE